MFHYGSHLDDFCNLSLLLDISRTNNKRKGKKEWLNRLFEKVGKKFDKNLKWKFLRIKNKGHWVQGLECCLSRALGVQELMPKETSSFRKKKSQQDICLFLIFMSKSLLKNDK